MQIRTLLPGISLPPWLENLADDILQCIKAALSLVVMVFSIPFLVLMTILPSAPLLMLLPAILPQETVIQASNDPSRTWTTDLRRRLFAMLIGAAALIAFGLFITELTRFIPLPRSNSLTTQVGVIFVQIMEGITGWKIQRAIPAHVLANWPLLITLVYVVDLVILAAMLRVPMAYNYRNLLVRWWTTLLVALAFMVVICLMIVMLSFVNGMYNLTEASGQKGNVIALADGATDEQFSTIQYSDVTNLEREWTDVDEDNNRLPPGSPKIQVARIQEGDRTTFLCSRETIIFANQPLPFMEVKLPGRGLMRVRGVADPEKLAALSGSQLESGSAWFGKSGLTPGGEIELVCGRAALKQLAQALKKPDLALGQTFELADKHWKVVGLLSSSHKQMEAEAWVRLDVLSTRLNNLATGSQKRRFLQIRGIVDPPIAEKVHALNLLPGSRWFSEAGVSEDKQEIEAVLGEGVAMELGGDQYKERLEVGDTFELADRIWKVVGIMKSEGSTFGSEIWAKQALIAPIFNRANYSSLVMRVEPDTLEAARTFAFHLKTRASPKSNAMAEIDYFARLQETNKQFLYAIIAVAAIMSIGGIFGVMVVMFAAINRRIRDIGAMRILGFKRWQILVSFLLESLGIAIFGGVLGCALGYLLADGRKASSIVSSGAGGGGKFVALTMNVDWNIILLGMLFALVMGRLGGLVPALWAMRLKILDALR
jgi:ABC-type lipoprotein release transport system permease subunit